MKKGLYKTVSVILCVLSALFIFSACVRFGAGHEVVGVSLSRTKIWLEVGENTLITATILPNDAKNKSVTWSSSDTSVVTVDRGRIYAKSVGQATVTAQTVSGGFIATCAINVTEPVVYTVKYQKYNVLGGKRIDVITSDGDSEIADVRLSSTSKVREFIPKSVTVTPIDTEEYAFYGWTINKKKFDGTKNAYNNLDINLTIVEFLQLLEQGDDTEKAIRNQIIETNVITVVAWSYKLWSDSH